jgi:hypothetical protein
MIIKLVKISQIFNNNPQGKDDQKAGGRTVYKQVLIDAKS